jgi:O-Antigen ligase
MQNGMQIAVPVLPSRVFKLRNVLLFTGVLLMHWTLLRPTPADAVFMLVLLLSVLCNPRFNARFVVFFVLVFIWTVCVYFSSIAVLSDREVQFQLLAHTFVVLVGFTGCLVGLTWEERHFETLMNVWIVASCIAASLGIFGFATGNEMFLWDGRAKGLFDEPIAFGAFLLPGLYGCMYHLSLGRRRALGTLGLLICMAGILLSFSRAAVFALFVFTPVYFVLLNRRNLGKAIAYLLIGIFLSCALIGTAMLTSETFQEKVITRATLGETYDTEHGGRYDRYYRSIPMILDNPTGLGMLQIDKIFPEPIHNIFLSSFLNYGWLAGVSWLLLTILSFKVAFQNQKATHSPMATWISFSLLSQLPCALLQQVEHWRHFWLLLGLLWGFKCRQVLAGRRVRPAPPTVYAAAVAVSAN